MVEHISIYFFIAFKTHKYTHTHTHMHSRKNNANASATATAAHLSVIFIRCAQRVHKQGTLQQNMQSNIFGNPVLCLCLCLAQPQNGWQSCWWYIPSVISIFRPAHMEAFADPTIFTLFIKFFRLCIVKSGRAKRFFFTFYTRVEEYLNFLQAWQTLQSIHIYF